MHLLAHRGVHRVARSGRLSVIQATLFSSVNSTSAMVSGSFARGCGAQQLERAARVVAQEELPHLGRELQGSSISRQDALERQQRVVGGEADLVLAEASS